MPYTPPPGNAVAPVNFGGPHTPPTGNAILFDFTGAPGSGGPYRRRRRQPSGVIT